jgi:hypothetical protein
LHWDEERLIVVGRYREVLQPRVGAVLDNRRRFVFIWKRQADGSWKIARSVGTDLAKDAAATPAATARRGPPGEDSTRRDLRMAASLAADRFNR